MIDPTRNVSFTLYQSRDAPIVALRRLRQVRLA